MKYIITETQLHYLRRLSTINDLINSDIFNEDVEAELVGYLLGIEEYLAYPDNHVIFKS